MSPTSYQLLYPAILVLWYYSIGFCVCQPLIADFLKLREGNGVHGIVYGENVSFMQVFFRKSFCLIGMTIDKRLEKV